MHVIIIIIWSVDAQRVQITVSDRWLLFCQDFSYNQLTEVPSDLDQSKNLLVLNLSNNQ